jgi:hypothetical protein
MDITSSNGTNRTGTLSMPAFSGGVGGYEDTAKKAGPIVREVILGFNSENFDSDADYSDLDNESTSDRSNNYKSGTSNTDRVPNPETRKIPRRRKTGNRRLSNETDENVDYGRGISHGSHNNHAPQASCAKFGTFTLTLNGTTKTYRVTLKRGGQQVGILKSERKDLENRTKALFEAYIKENSASPAPIKTVFTLGKDRAITAYLPIANSAPVKYNAATIERYPRVYNPYLAVEDSFKRAATPYPITSNSRQDEELAHNIQYQESTKGEVDGGSGTNSQLPQVSHY